MTIIDTHAHIYPDKIALMAAQSIGEFYEIPMHLDGTVSSLLKAGEINPEEKTSARHEHIKKKQAELVASQSEDTQSK